MLRKQDDVGLALGQVGHGDGENVQTVEEVFAELALGNELFKVTASGRQEAHIGMEFFVAAYTAESAFLQETQKLDLSLHGEITNFVQEKRAAIGSLGTSDTAVHRPRKCPLLVTKQFAFHQVLGESGAVQGDEGFVLSCRQIHNGTGNHFLTRSAPAADQHRGIAGSHLTDLLVNLLHLAAVTHQVTGVVRKHVAKLAVFFQHGLAFVVKLDTLVGGVARDVRDDFQQGHIAVQIRSTINWAVDGERTNHLTVVNQRNADESHLIFVMAAPRTVQKTRILAQVGNHVTNATFGHMTRNALAHAVITFLLLGFIKPARRLNLEGIAKEQRESAAQHAEFGFQNAEHVLEQLFNVAFVNDGNADLLDYRNF